MTILVTNTHACLALGLLTLREVSEDVRSAGRYQEPDEMLQQDQAALQTPIREVSFEDK